MDINTTTNINKPNTHPQPFGHFFFSYFRRHTNTHDVGIPLLAVYDMISTWYIMHFVLLYYVYILVIHSRRTNTGIITAARAVIFHLVASQVSIKCNNCFCSRIKSGNVRIGNTDWVVLVFRSLLRTAVVFTCCCI